MATHESRVTAVMITYNRREEVLRSLDKISALPEQPSIILVDNGSIDGTFDAVGARFPHVERVRGSRNLGAAARNLGVKRARTPYVALCDDDTWWAPGNLTRAADLLDAYAHVAVLTARLLNGPDEVEDAICRTLATSPVRGREPLPGKALLGFLAGASVVRRDAFLEAGGFDSRFFIGGEEELLAIEFAVRGWALCYVPELIVHHYPSSQRDSKLRNFHVERNRLWVAWLRRPALRAWRATLSALREVANDWRSVSCLIGALAGLPWILRERRVVPADVEEQLLLLETSC